MARRPEGPPPPPTVQKVRIHYTKRGRLRFSSHRDFQRAFERAIRRGNIPVAFSAGFNPHPKVSYANAAPTGVASEAEYVEIGLAMRCDVKQLAAVLDESLPTGFDVVEVVEVKEGSLADRLEASAWLIEFPGSDPAAVDAAVAAFLAADEVQVQRMTKNGMRHFDARSAVVTLGPVLAGSPDWQVAERAVGAIPAGCAILKAVVRHTTPAVRPDDVLYGLREISGLTPSNPPRVTRLAQGPLDTQTAVIADPLDRDRDVITSTS